MATRKPVVCEQKDSTCKGRVRRVPDPVALEVYGQRQMVLLCDKHLGDRHDEI